MPETRKVKEYRARFHVPNESIAATLVSANRSELERTIETLCGSKRVKFEQADDNTTFIWDQDSNQVLGQLYNYSVPEHMSVRNLIEHKKETTKAA